MNPNDLPLPHEPTPSAPDVFHQLGAITRQLHDTLNMLGGLPSLVNTANGLPDARSRLTYIATKTEQAAEKVLNLVDEAKQDQNYIAEETRKLAALMVKDPVKAVASGAVMNFVHEVESTTKRVDGHLTDIMMAQDFHDLTGQVVAKVVALASDLEAQLVHLLVQAAPPDQAQKVVSNLTAPAPMQTQPALSGPVVDPSNRTDVVANQSEVDDLLATLGF